MHTLVRLQVTCVLTAVALTAAGRQLGENSTRVQELQGGETLSAYRTSFWRADPNASRYWCSAGSCLYSNDLAHQALGSDLHTWINIPGDKRKHRSVRAFPPPLTQPKHSEWLSSEGFVASDGG